MDKNSIKKYAIWAREELIRRVSAKMEEYGVSKENPGDAGADAVNGRLLSKVEKTQRQRLIAQVKKDGYEQVIEEVAYTWFNRLIALRFMEVNNYLPAHVRVFTDENNNFRPQILTEALHLELDGLDMDHVIALKQTNDTDALYKYLLIAQCNALNNVLPQMFQKIEDYTELLFPDNILREGSVIHRMVTDIPENNWRDQVQIIGWLYQYYNSVPKDTVFANLKKNIKIRKEDIPAATQLFTPDWIVRYMVENSLGRLWIARNSASRMSEEDEGPGDLNEYLLLKWNYYLADADQEPEVQEQLEKMRMEYRLMSPEEIKVIDPCMGSGHILVYLFDVLMQIYESCGYSPRDAVRSILENNLYGLDIDDRAAQLAYFSVMMKAVSYDSRFLRRGDIPQPNVYSPKGYEEGEEYGSLLLVEELEPRPEPPQELSLLDERYEDQLIRWNFRRLLAQKYHVVVTNPPYMAVSNASGKMQDYVKKNFSDSKADLFACFIERCGQLAGKNGYQAMITQHAWMFLSSFEKLRAKLQAVDTVNMVHLGARAFEEIGGEVVQTTSFVMRKSHIKGYKGTYCRLIEPTTQQGKEDMFLAGENRYIAQQDNFSKIPGSPVAYWVSERFIEAFDHPKIGDYGDANNGFTTGDNSLFLRIWYEVQWGNICLHATSHERAIASCRKWFPYNKGGGFRKWYGNNDYIINWFDNGSDIRAYGHLVPRSMKYQFQKSISWSKISSSISSFRMKDAGTMFDVAGLSLFPYAEEDYYCLLGVCNSCFSQKCLEFLSPTLNYETGHIVAIPVLMQADEKSAINCFVKENIDLAKIDWDSFETSWDFTCHPLVRLRMAGAYAWGDNQPTMKIASVYKAWELECEGRFNQLKANEEELNRIFIDIYGLQNELTPEVEDKDVTVRKADLGRDVRSLISYAVGCMFGRYSLDAEGLAYAGGDWDVARYKTFQPDRDNIIPICDDDYFEDDVTGRFVRWMETVYGKDTLEENLKFIADALGGKGNPREVIRNYFLNDFYTDHCKIYQKRPIYWLFDSGKKNGFKALVYLHRYQPDLLARMRTDYVHEQQARYRTAIDDLERRIAGATTAERVKLDRQLTKLKDQDAELRGYEEKIHHLADQMIDIDLDDGVKVNYSKFEDVLAKIK